MSSSDDLVLFRRAPASLRRAPLREFAFTLREKVGGGREFCCLITDDRELRRLNREFLSRDYPTDVISFPMGTATSSGDKPTADSKKQRPARLWGGPPGPRPAPWPAFCGQELLDCSGEERVQEDLRRPGGPLHSFGQDSRWYLGEMAISADRAAVQAREFGHSQLDEIRILMLHGTLHLLGMNHETDRGEMARAEARWRKKLSLPPCLIARAS